MWTSIAKILYKLLALIFIMSMVAVVIIGAVLFHFGNDLPDYKQLANYTPPLVTRFYSFDNQLIDEHAVEYRILAKIDEIPKKVINAFLAAEDKNFYEHPGLDISSITRAMFKNILNIGSNKSLVGGSTITQQVVKNFLLTNERSFTRKIKEAILSFRISQAYSKDKILELYLNQIYLGNGAYGVAYAGLSYFNKALKDLKIEEVAYLASLPKAPSNYDPKKHYDRALRRRNWVIERMQEEGFISENEAKIAASTPLNIVNRVEAIPVKAESFSESVRREIISTYGAKNLYEGGLSVFTTMDPEFQKIAEKAFRNGLIKYDKKYGYRGPLNNVINISEWRKSLIDLPEYKLISPWNAAIIIEVHNDKALIEVENGKHGVINIKEVTWAKSQLKNLKEIFKKGDIIIVELLDNLKSLYTLRQIPKADGGLVAIEPSTGRILAMVGGFSSSSEFNRVTQAKRQPGSAFKPFVYLAALENGFTPASIIVDGPIELNQGPGLPPWRPKNYSGDFLGPTTLRRGLEKSRNTMTVRLAQLIGIKKLIEVTERFGISENPPRNFSLVLGATETTLLNLTNAFGMLINGGKKIKPSQIEYIQDSNGVAVYKRDSRECTSCEVEDDDEKIDIFSFIPPELIDNREQITDPRTAYQMVSLLEGVVQRGTGASANKLGLNIGGKTGTTNDSNDVWFVGFSHNLVVGTYIGYDSPKSLGARETGASTALPIFVEFMEEALAKRPNSPFVIPRGIKLVKIDALTGQPTSRDLAKDVIYEVFKDGSEPIEDENSDSDFDSIFN
ncbi:MAG: penicillin-binding protein 1A [Alphaproteobacteria bacterium]